MKKSLLVFLVFWGSVATLCAQEVNVKVALYKDTVGYEENIQVTFTVENTQNADFEAPAFAAFAEAVRMSTASNMSFVNGQMSQSVSYTYSVKPYGEGIFEIEPATVEIDGQIYQSELVSVVVTNEATTPSPAKERSIGEVDMFDMWRRGGTFQMPEMEDLMPKPRQKEEKKEATKPKTKRKVYKL